MYAPGSNPGTSSGPSSGPESCFGSFPGSGPSSGPGSGTCTFFANFLQISKIILIINKNHNKFLFKKGSIKPKKRASEDKREE